MSVVLVRFACKLHESGPCHVQIRVSTDFNAATQAVLAWRTFIDFDSCFKSFSSNLTSAGKMIFIACRQTGRQLAVSMPESWRSGYELSKTEVGISIYPTFNPLNPWMAPSVRTIWIAMVTAASTGMALQSTLDQYLAVERMTHNGHNHEKKTISRSLYISHFISTWNSRGFEFGAVLFLAAIFPGTLLQVSIYALCRSLAAIIFSSMIGSYIDTSNRLKVIRISIIGQRIAVVFSCSGFLVLLSGTSLATSVRHGLFLILVILAAIEKLSIIMNTISVERDWVVVISGQDESLLNMMNSQMRRIDLFCKLTSPLLIALLDSWSTRWALIATLGFNIISVLIEYVFIAYVYHKTPQLSETASRAPVQLQDGTPPTKTIQDAGFTQWQRIKTYTKSPAFWPSLSLSILFLTVLSFAGQMITYLTTLSLSSTHIGIIRTIATICEISATFIAPILISRIGSIRAGIWSLSWQCFCLTPGVAMLWIGNVAPLYSTPILIASVILSRAGLWSFDLVAQIQVQNSVDANQRGSFSATESSLQNIFELFAFAMTIVWSKPVDFRFPVTISLAAVYLAAICYARFVRLSRGHLFHLPPCCESVHGYKPIQENTGNNSYGLIDRV